LARHTKREREHLMNTFTDEQVAILIASIIISPESTVGLVAELGASMRDLVAEAGIEPEGFTQLVEKFIDAHLESMGGTTH
jgi:hypothetical protein